MTRLGICASLLALLAASAFAGQWSGVVSEEKCGARHTAGNDGDVKCVTACVKAGAKPVLVVDGKVIKIANTEKVMDHLGRKVTVTGSLEGDTLTIDSIKGSAHH